MNSTPKGLLDRFFPFLLITLLFATGCSSEAGTRSDEMAGENGTKEETESSPSTPEEMPNLEGMSRAYFASGCFWCVEGIFESVKGVAEVVSGYSGGEKENPTYEEVGRGGTGHAESVEVYYDPKVVSYETLVQVFYDSQDPTTVGQEPDFGSQYRSIIFYQNDDEKKIAEEAKAQVASSGMYGDKPIVTEIVPFRKFWPAEDYHQNYVRIHPDQSYVRGVSIPRIKEFQQKHPELLK